MQLKGTPKKECDNLSINCAFVCHCTKQNKTKVLYACLILDGSSRINCLALLFSVSERCRGTQ